MDPTSNMKEQLELAQKMVREFGSSEDAVIDQHDAIRLAELVIALHEWINQKEWHK